MESEDDKKGPNGEHCFVITDNGNHDWKICSQSENVRNMWFCKIQELRKETQPHYCEAINSDSNIKIVVKNVRKNIIFYN